ncbi:hypothetical protein OA42_03100 [Klebsiella michiganensis]|nr:hypothetical protein OA42_03100 [Klebsiella michiganensis]
MRVGRRRGAGSDTCAFNDAVSLLSGKAGPAARDKHRIAFISPIPTGANLAPAFKRVTFIKTQGMHRREAVLQSTDIDASFIEIKIPIMQIKKFTDAHTMAKR